MPPLRVLSVSRRGAASLAVDRFAGRYALGKNQLPVQKKAGADFLRGEVATRVVGGACSEVLGGANLAALLKPGFELEARGRLGLVRDWGDSSLL